MTDVSRGIFGATVGVDRLLKLWDKYGIKTSWFVPAHSIESFPKQMAKVRDAGHEMYVSAVCTNLAFPVHELSDLVG